MSANGGRSMTGREDRRVIDRSIASLAIPALGALVAEPLFLIVDSAMIGHLGAEPLAGLAIASTIFGRPPWASWSSSPKPPHRWSHAGEVRGISAVPCNQVLMVSGWHSPSGRCSASHSGS